MHKPYIIKFTDSAILYEKDEKEIIKTGTRHHEIIKQIHEDGDTAYYKKWHIDGFIIEYSAKTRFISRQEATELAYKLNIPLAGSVLTSEDLW